MSKINKQNVLGAVNSLTADITSKALNTGGFHMESFGQTYGTDNDVQSGPILARIKQTISEAGLAGLFGSRPSVAVHKQKKYANGIHFEDMSDAEPGTTGDDNGNEATLTEAQEKAGVIAAAMADDPAGWAKKAAEATNDAEHHANNTDIDESFAERVKMESYDNSNFRDAVGYSVIWNVVAARQSNALENIWPTIVLDPNASHVEATVQFQVFHQEVRHKATGESAIPVRPLLLEAIIDGSILDENIIKVVPVFEAGVSEDAFVDPAVIAHRQVTVEGEEVTTGPLKVGKVHNLLGLGAAAIAGLTREPNTSMQLAPMPRLENLYVEIVSSSDTSIVRLDASSLSRASFTAAPEGNSREIQLNLHPSQLALDVNTVDTTGAPAAALDFLRTPAYQNHRLEYGLSIYGTGNLQYGEVKLTTGEGEIKMVKAANSLGHFTKETDDTIATTLSGSITSIRVIGFDIDASRTNIDRQQRGPLTDVRVEREKYYIRLGSPISTIFPATEAVSNIDLVAPLTATRIKNDYYGIKALKRYASVLSGLAVSYEHGMAATDLKAIGKWVMTPYFRHYRLSVLDVVDSLRSKDKLEDTQHAILNVIRDIVIHAMRDSRYELALQVQTGSAEAVPTMAAITNSVLGKYLFQQGDTRLLGSLPYPFVVGTHASNLLGEYGADEHEIFIVPTLPGTQMDALNFGHMLWKPELASTLQVTRDGSTNRELVVQPAMDHHMLCPMIIQITVSDITAIMNSKTAVAMLV